MSFEKELVDLVGAEYVKTAEPLSKHTTFRIGGPADYYVQPDLTQVQKVIELCKLYKEDYLVLGNGSNVLFGDKGYRGTIIEIGSRMKEAGISEDGKLTAQAGVMLIATAAMAAAAGFTGLEFASGIPGTLGGALIMNAGAYGGEMKDIVESVTVLTPEGECVTYGADDYDGGYRSSRLMKEKDIVLSATLQLRKGDSAQIQQTMEELKEKRMTKQPLEFPSAGSTFKRPEGYFAGKLIMDSGLAGYRVGDAQVSEKHCGFVINLGNASASEVKQLMDDVTRIVQEKYNVVLEPEVRVLGDF